MPLVVTMAATAGQYLVTVPSHQHNKINNKINKINVSLELGTGLALNPTSGRKIALSEGEKAMLSDIVNLVSNYEHLHGARPNLVYMNETHYTYLREELPGVRDHDSVAAIVGVDIALSDEAIRPHVATVRYGSENILSS